MKNNIPVIMPDQIPEVMPDQIPESLPNHNEKSILVALYIKGSTDQTEMCIKYLASNTQYKLCASYIDECTTGTSAKETQFMQMLEHAKAGNFDMIITPEVSRFAKNANETLRFTKYLHHMGVEVFFINDGIKTFDADGNFRLIIMAGMSEEESRKISARVKSAHETSMKNGVVFGNGKILGYEKITTIHSGKKDVKFIINPEQAETVRLIYEMYLAGNGPTKIKKELERQGRLTALGKKTWHTSTISYILSNPFYYGVIEYHKTYTSDYLTQKKIKNHGEVDFLQVKGKHEPIITEEEFKKVQEIRASKNNKNSKKSHPGLDKNPTAR